MDAKKSTFKVLYGKYKFNKNPWVPLGCVVELHVMPNKQKTWGNTSSQVSISGTLGNTIVATKYGQ